MLELLRKIRIPLLAVAMILAALLFYSLNLRQREGTSLHEKHLLGLAAPFQSGLHLRAGGGGTVWGRYFWLIDTERENERLRAEVRSLRAEIESMHEVELANERLRRLLEFRDSNALSAVTAQVIADDASSWFRTILINRGTSDGLSEGMPVVVAEGVVGRLIRCGAKESRVLLETDASSAIAVLVQRDRTRGIARGRGDLMTLEYVDRQAELEVGDLVITSGTGGVFPKGLPVGRVVSVTRGEYGLFQSVTLLPDVDFTRLEEVLVLLKAGS